MNVLKCLLSGITLLILCSCAQNTPHLNPEEFKQCTLMCTKHLEFCQKNCTQNCRTCSSKADLESALDFKKYVHEEEVRGGYILRSLKSYRDPLQCRKVSCNCASDYLVCKQNCTGLIPKKLQTVPYCT